MKLYNSEEVTITIGGEGVKVVDESSKGVMVIDLQENKATIFKGDNNGGLKKYTDDEILWDKLEKVEVKGKTYRNIFTTTIGMYIFIILEEED